MKIIRKVAIVIAVAATSWFAFGREQLERNRFYKFERAQWTNAKESERYFMARFLIDTEALKEKTKDEVVGLLGKPNRDSNVMMHYNLGSERGSLFAIDDDWLEIRLEEIEDQPIVQSIRIRPD